MIDHKRGKYRKGIFAVVYSLNEDSKIEYAILKRKKHWIGWEFVKGKIEKFESRRKAVKREVSEETGLKILKIKKFNLKEKYEYGERLSDRPGIVGQTFKLFSVRVEKGKLKIDKREHSEAKWVSYREAYKLLTWPNQRRSLKIVNASLQK